MPTFTVLVTDVAWPSLDIEREILEQVDAELVLAERGDAEELTWPCRSRRSDSHESSAAFHRGARPRRLVVSRFGIGVDNIPVARATELGIIVTNVPGFCTDEVSDTRWRFS